jgi:hypothetical protein
MPVLSWEQVAAVAVKAGFPPGPAVIATAITMPESGRNASVIQQGEPYSRTGWGLWQITPGNSEPQYGVDKQLLDPYWNARAAWQKWSDAGGFGPWTTFQTGAYGAWIPDAEQAVSAVTHLSQAQLDTLVGGARTYRDAGEPPPSGVANWTPLIDASARSLQAQAVQAQTMARAVAALRGPWRTPVPHPPDPRRVIQPVRRIGRG